MHAAPDFIDTEGLANAVRLMGERQSVRRYADEPVPTNVLEQLLDCATCAPSAHNRQPWRFAVVRADASKTRLAAAMGAKLRSDRLTDGDAADLVEADVARSFQRITGAPVVIVVASSLRDMDAYPDARRCAAEAAMALQSTAMAVQNLLLAASAAGLGACWMCAPLFCPDTVRDALALPPDWQPQALVTLGFPLATPARRPRRPLHEVVRKDPAP